MNPYLAYLLTVAALSMLLGVASRILGQRSGFWDGHAIWGVVTLVVWGVLTLIVNRVGPMGLAALCGGSIGLDLALYPLGALALVSVDSPISKTWRAGASRALRLQFPLHVGVSAVWLHDLLTASTLR